MPSKPTLKSSLKSRPIKVENRICDCHRNALHWFCSSNHSGNQTPNRNIIARFSQLKSLSDEIASKIFLIRGSEHEPATLQKHILELVRRPWTVIPPVVPTMEVVGAVASIVALIEVGKKLKECVDMIPANKCRLRDVAISISQDLEALQEIVQSCQSTIDTSKLYEAISSLEADLEIGLERCQKLLKSMDNYSWRRWPMIFLKDGDDTETQLLRIEQKISICCRRFSMRGIARIELNLGEITCMTQQLREEVHERLNVVEDNLRFRVAKATADQTDAEVLVGVPSMTELALRNALDKASTDLERRPRTALEGQYLHLKVETLTKVVALLPAGDTTPRQTHSFSHGVWETHYAQIGDPAEQTEDIIMGTMQILSTLRTREDSSPVMQIAADLEDLSVGLLDLGLYEDARHTYLEVVRIYRGSLSGETPPAIMQARVARALIGVSASCLRLGKSQEGLESTQEAASIFRCLETASPGEFRHGLALALNNMANHLRDSGLYAQARNAANEAVELRRQLTKDLPAIHKADLAASLLNASTCCSKIPGLERQALENVVEAVSLSRELSAKQPGIFSPYLGASLHNSANRRAEMNDNFYAYKDIQEAVAIRRKLAMARPDVFSGGLSRSLNVARVLALKCEDIVGADCFYEERQCLCRSSPVHNSSITNPSVRHGPTLLSATTMHESAVPGTSTVCGSAIPETPESCSSAFTSNTVLHPVISPGRLPQEVGLKVAACNLIEQISEVTPTQCPTARDVFQNPSLQLATRSYEMATCESDENSMPSPCSTLASDTSQGSTFFTGCAGDNNDRRTLDNSSSHNSLFSAYESSPPNSAVLECKSLISGSDETLTIPHGGGSHSINEQDVIIAFMGPTGSGKSTFVNTATGQPSTPTGHDLDSCTQNVRAIRCPHPDGSGRNIVFVDTPGFNGSERTDYDILKAIAGWLKSSYEQRITLTGILLFHCISESRMGGSLRNNLTMLQELCGEDALQNIIITTTMWNQVTKDIGLQRVDQLQEAFLQPMMSCGCRIAHFDLSHKSAWEIIDHFDFDARRPLKLQIEMVVEGKELSQTGAFNVLLGWWKKLVARWKRMLRKREIHPGSTSK